MSPQNSDTPNVDDRSDGRVSSQVTSVAIVGAGVMGRQIAEACLQRGVRVVLQDSDPDILNRSVHDLQQLYPSTEVSGDTAQTGSADVVLEAIVENRRAKRKLLATMEPQLQPSALLATNTSSLPIDDIASALSHPERFCGLHFCHPVADRRLVEVVHGPKTHPEYLARAVAFVRQLDKQPVVVRDSPGFVLNRLLRPYLMEALQLLREGICPLQIEEAATEFGMECGPLTKLDAFGIDVIVRCGAVLREFWPNDEIESELLPDLYRSGSLGEKTGCGIFDYAQPAGPDNRRPLNPIVVDWLQRESSGTAVFAAGELRLRLFLPMLLEATRILEDNIVRRPADIDSVLRHGVNFKPTEGGLLAWADTIGASQIAGDLACFHRFGKRYASTPLLRRLAAANGSFLQSRLPAVA